MNSKIKKLSGLKRRLEVKVDSNDYNSSYSAKLKKIRSTVKLDGFRKGSAPDNVIIQKYGIFPIYKKVQLLAKIVF